MDKVIQHKQSKANGRITSLIDGETYAYTNGQFTRHLKSHGLTYQDYYEKYVTGISSKCPFCEERKQFYSPRDEYANTCGSKACVGLKISQVMSDWSNDKKILVNSRKSKAQERRSKEEVQRIRSKAKATCLEKYGVESNFQTEEMKEKSRKTKLERYGNEYYANWEKSAEKNRSKTPEEQNIINEKRRRTNLELIGYENHFMLPTARRKSMKSNASGKEYTLPSGKIVSVRGHEGKALDILFAQGYREEEILIDDCRNGFNLGMPIFEYVNANEHKQKYYPDIYLLKENKIVEIKGQWWWDGYGREEHKGRLRNNLFKTEAVMKRGYLYEVWLYNEKEKNFEIMNYERIQKEYQRL